MALSVCLIEDIEYQSQKLLQTWLKDNSNIWKKVASETHMCGSSQDVVAGRKL